MTNKLLLAAIALGLWANVWVTLVQPTQAQPDYLSSIAQDLHLLVAGDVRCRNQRICEY